MNRNGRSNEKMLWPTTVICESIQSLHFCPELAKRWRPRSCRKQPGCQGSADPRAGRWMPIATTRPVTSQRAALSTNFWNPLILAASNFSRFVSSFQRWSQLAANSSQVGSTYIARSSSSSSPPVSISKAARSWSRGSTACSIALPPIVPIHRPVHLQGCRPGRSRSQLHRLSFGLLREKKCVTRVFLPRVFPRFPGQSQKCGRIPPERRPFARKAEGLGLTGGAKNAKRRTGFRSAFDQEECGSAHPSAGRLVGSAVDHRLAGTDNGFLPSQAVFNGRRGICQRLLYR